MKGIKLSALLNKKLRISGNRKSKGQLNFVNKIKYFYLTFKYNTFKIDRLSDMQLNEFISLLNIRKLGCYEAIKALKNEKTDIDNDVEYFTEQIGSMSPNRYLDENMGNKLRTLNIQAEKRKKQADQEISENLETIDEIEKFKDELKTELEIREIDKAVEAKTESNPMASNIRTIADKDLDSMIEEVTKEESEEKGLTDEELNEMSEKIVNNTLVDEVKTEEPKVEEVVTEPIKEEPVKEEVSTPITPEPVVETPAVEPVKETPVAESLETVKEEAEETLYDIIKANTNTEFSQAQDEFAKQISSSIANYFKRINEITTGTIEKIQAEDIRVAEEAIDAKNNEIKAEQNKNAELTKENEGLTNDLNKANTTIAERDKTIEGLNATVDQKNNEITDEKDKNAKLEQANKNLESEKESLIKENDSKDAKIKELEEALKARNDELAARDKIINEKDDEIAGLNAKVDEVQKEKQAAMDKFRKTEELIKGALLSVGTASTGEESAGSKKI